MRLWGERLASFFIMQRQKKEPKLIPHRVVRISLNRRLIMYLWKKPEITRKDYLRVCTLNRQIEDKKNELNHVQSIVERIKLKYNLQGLG